MTDDIKKDDTSKKEAAPKKAPAKKATTAGASEKKAPAKKTTASKTTAKKTEAAPKTAAKAKPETAAPAAEADVAPQAAAAPKAETPKAKAPATEKAKAAKPVAKAKNTDAEDEGRTTLRSLKPAEGSNRLRTRVGRGRASGHGKTSGRGHNGEGQRSGRSSKRGFEGGQMPLYRKIPKINGFQIINTKKWLELTTKKVETLANRAGKTSLKIEDLVQLGLFNPKRMYGVRIIGNQPLSAALQLEAHYATPSAKAAIEKAGGSLSLQPTSVEKKVS